MKLISIKLCNFRQFFGKTLEINFAIGERNTTVIHGNNGAGKTTILNAFTWVLYEKFTAAFASPELLINKLAIARADPGVSVEYWVEIKFEHENKRYQLKRKAYGVKDRNDEIQCTQSKLFMLVAGDDGRWYPPLEQPEDIINRILPESLHQYFFFDGERIDHIFRYKQKNNIAEDTKELLGVKVLDRAIDHLKKAKRALEEELKEIGDSETKTLLQRQIQQEKERDRLWERQQRIEKEIEEREEDKKMLAARLLELSGVEELQRLRQKLETQEKASRQNLLEAKNNLKRQVSHRGQAVFLLETTLKFRSLLNGLRAKGELVSGIKQEFIRELLERQYCICGSELAEGTDTYRQVRAWIDKAGVADLEESTIRVETRAGDLEKQIDEFWYEVDREQATIEHSRSEIARVENELDELKKKLRNYPDEDIQQLQRRIDEIEEDIKDLTLEQGGNRISIELLDREVKEINKQIDKQKLREEKSAIAHRRIRATAEAIERSIEVRSRLEIQFRIALEKRVREIFSSISFTPYLPKLNHNYELILVENTSGQETRVAASTGENQILSLSFIGAIIDRVREWSQKNTLMGPDSSTFPIIMDSPFGSLDEIYRRQVARSIPLLANQLVILATKTQWRGEVDREISQYIGKEYVLAYYSPKPECQEDAIELNGVTYPLVKRGDNEFEYTEIIEVKPQV